MAAYDCLRILRKIVPHASFIVGIEDFFYWTVVGSLTFQFLFQENDGVIRWFALAGIGLGMGLFTAGISRFTVPALVWAGEKLLWIPRKILRFFVDKIHKNVTKIRKS